MAAPPQQPCDVFIFGGEGWSPNPIDRKRTVPRDVPLTPARNAVHRKAPVLQANHAQMCGHTVARSASLSNLRPGVTMTHPGAHRA